MLKLLVLLWPTNSNGGREECQSFFMTSVKRLNVCLRVIVTIQVTCLFNMVGELKKTVVPR